MTFALTLAVSAALAGGQARAQAPLSAIDWLEETLRPSAGLPQESGAGAGDAGHPVSPAEPGLWERDRITMQPIDAPSAGAVGLFPAARLGLPADLWGQTPATELAALVRALPSDTLPVLRGLALGLLLAEFDPPPVNRAGATGGTGGTGETEIPDGGAQDAAISFVTARIDALIGFGALDQAAALLDTLDSDDLALRARAFDIALLLGEEGRECLRVLAADAAGSPAAPRIFCLARDGRWDEAERLHARLTESGTLRQPYRDLLAHFLDADDLMHAETLPDFLREDYVQPQNLSPLAWRILEATGAPVAAHGLPVAFAHADLRGTIGWRAQLEAAERLVRSGALPPNRLLGLYTERNAAASGGIWERVRAVQRLEAALDDGSASAVAPALQRVWPLIVDAELEVAFASLYAASLLDAPLGGEAALLAARIGLLDSDPARAARRLAAAAGAADRFLAAVVLGSESGDAASLARGALQESVAEALATPLPPLPQALADQVEAGRAGAGLLIALARLGGVIDPNALGQALVLMRHLGLEESARTAALQALLLDRRG